MNRRTTLARQSLRAAMEMRRNLAIPREAAINAFDAAKMVGIDVRFLDAPSLEGMFVREPGLRILLPTLQHRPRSRILYSCAHEIGHQQFGHGTKADEYLDVKSNAPIADEEFLADSFAGHLLMPRPAVLDAFARRTWTPDTATPMQIFTVAAELGVGYESLLTHLCFSLELITRPAKERLAKISPKAIKADISGCENNRVLVFADSAWKWVPVDAERGDLIGLPDGAGDGCHLLKHEFQRGDHSFYRAAGVGTAKLVIGSQEVGLRISRANYIGPYINRYLADPDEC